MTEDSPEENAALGPDDLVPDMGELAEPDSNDPSVEIRKSAIEALRLWYSRREQTGRLRYARANEKESTKRKLAPPPDPVRHKDPLAERKKEHPEYYKSQVKRAVTDSQGRPMTDARGRVVYEYVPIDAATTARGTETRQRPGSKAPRGIGSTTPVTGITFAQPQTVYRDPYGYISQVMLRIGIVNPVSHHALEMYAAGFSVRKMATKFGKTKRSKSWVQETLEVGLNMLAFCVVTQCSFGTAERRKRASDRIGGKSKSRKMTAADVGLHVMESNELGGMVPYSPEGYGNTPVKERTIKRVKASGEIELN